MKKSSHYIIALTLAVLLVKSCCMISEADGACPDPILVQYEYKLTGTAELTGEHVLAYLNQDPSTPSTLTGIVLDRTKRFLIIGIWSGKGQVYARSTSTPETYRLEVIQK